MPEVYIFAFRLDGNARRLVSGNDDDDDSDSDFEVFPRLFEIRSTCCEYNAHENLRPACVSFIGDGFVGMRKTVALFWVRIVRGLSVCIHKQ